MQAKIIQLHEAKQTMTIDEFLQSLEAEGKSPLTVRQYRSSFNRFIKWYDGDDPSEATQRDIAAFKRFMVEGGANGRPLSPNTQRQTLTHLKAYFGKLAEVGEVIDNPVERIDAVKVAKSAPKWLDNKQQNNLLGKVNRYGNIRELAMIQLMLFAGLRVQELVDLLRSDIVISERKGSVTVREGKHGKFREVPLNKDLRRTLAAYMEAYEGDTASHLFVSTSNNSKGKKISTRSVQLMIEKYRKLTEIDSLTCHSLRHSFGHDLVQSGAPLNQVAELLGHMKSNGLPNIEMTLIYTRPSQDDLQAAVERLSWT